MKKQIIIFFVAIFATIAQAENVDKAHQQKNEQSHNESNVIELTQEQKKLAGIETIALTGQPLSISIIAPGEIKANGYTSYYVSPRVDSVVIERHAILGEQVQKGQPLVTLFSEVVAQVQADYRLAFADWQRVKNLTNSSLSEQQKLAAKTRLVALTSQLKAYGLTESALNNIVTKEEVPLGVYRLVALRSGAVISDDFHQGQGVSSGETIMVLSDESQLWVEARIAPSNTSTLPVGTVAQIILADKLYQANVIQSSHTIDAVTRTRTVRLLVDNIDHQLHSGMFVEVKFLLSIGRTGFAVPQSALIRSADGDWQLFVEEKNGIFQAIEVRLGQGSLVTENQKIWQEVVISEEGHSVEAGEMVVISGAFFLASQANKSSFDIHNH